MKHTPRALGQKKAILTVVSMCAHYVWTFRRLVGFCLMCIGRVRSVGRGRPDLEECLFLVALSMKFPRFNARFWP